MNTAKGESAKATGTTTADLARWALEVDLARVPSAALRRLIAEVRGAQGEQGERRRGYDRAYNRHHRSGGYDRAYNRHHRGR